MVCIYLLYVYTYGMYTYLLFLSDCLAPLGSSYGMYIYGMYTDGIYTDGMYSNGMYTDGRYTYGRYTYGRYSYGRYTYCMYNIPTVCIPTVCMPKVCIPMVCITMVCITMVCIPMQARLWACGRGDMSTPSFGSDLNPISPRGADCVHPIYWCPHQVLKATGAPD